MLHTQVRPLYAVHPCVKRAHYLNAALREKLAQSLTYLVEINCQRQALPSPKKEDFWNSLKNIQKVPPLFYALNSLLQEALEQEPAAPLEQLLALLDTPLVNDIHIVEFQEEKTQAAQLKNTILQKYMLFDFVNKTSILSPSAPASQKTQELICRALNLIEQHDLELYQEMTTFISECLIFESEGTYIKAGSTFDLFGLVYINAANGALSVINMVDTLIHEAAHLYLYSLSTNDALVTNDYEERFYSPIRKSERSLIGIFHAAFVLTRVRMFLSRMQTSPDLLPEESGEVDSLLNKYELIIEESLDTVFAHANLTPLGKKLLQGTKEVLYSGAIRT